MPNTRKSAHAKLTLEFDLVGFLVGAGIVTTVALIATAFGIAMQYLLDQAFTIPY